MGLASGDAPEFWNVDEPGKITALYAGAVGAGSDLFLTNTFGGNASRLKLHDGQHRVRELNRAAAELGREVADKSGRTVIVAGSMGPTGEIMAPMGPLTHELAVEMFHEQAEGLKEGGADVLWVETISAPEEYKAAAEAARLSGMPWCGTMSFDTAGRTMMGLTPPPWRRWSSGWPTRRWPTARTAASAPRTSCAPCSASPRRAASGRSSPRATPGIPKYHEGHIHYDGTPELMADYAVLARDCGATIIGGCCGTTPEHLRHMRAALETRARGDRPTLDRIVEALGGFSSASDGTDGAGPAPPRAARADSAGFARAR
jgi:5-methyltetrahydrofolate--homocysteine methyltransferase